MVQYYPNTYEKIYTKTLNFLSYKPRGEKEIVDRLRRYLSLEKISESEKTALEERLLHALKSDGYLDDSRVIDQYLQNFVSSSKKKSISSFKQALLKKGFNKSDVEDALSEISTEIEVERVKEEAQKKLRKIAELPMYQKRRKLQEYLYRKGYNSSSIKAVVDSLL